MRPAPELLLLHTDGLSAFFGGWMISCWAFWTMGDLLHTALTGFVGALASYLGAWIAKRLLPPKGGKPPAKDR